MSYDAIDDDELLAPLGYSQEDPADDEESDELQGEWQFAHGFPDTRRSVRIWVDEDTRHLTKVRLSTRWRDRLGTHRLEDAFAEAFFLANARVGDVPTLQPPALEECEGDPSLTWDDYPQIEEKIQSLLDKAVKLTQRDPEDIRWADFSGEQVSATSAHGNVTVTLSLAGLTDSVRFDKAWLAKARMNDINEAVQSAHEKAYAKYVPPTFVPGDHEELAQELAAARGALRSIASKDIV